MTASAAMAAAVRSSPIFVSGDAAAWEIAGPGVRRQVLCWNGAIMLVRVAFETGALGPAHSHPHVQCTLVASGRFELTIGAESRVLESGGSFIVPSGMVHSARALEGGELVDCFTPMREDLV